MDIVASWPCSKIYEHIAFFNIENAAHEKNSKYEELNTDDKFNMFCMAMNKASEK